MKKGSADKSKSVRFSAAVISVTAAFLFYLTITPGTTAVGRSTLTKPSAVPAVVFNANGGSLGAIPDHVGTCQTPPFNGGRNVIFNASGLTGSVVDVQVSMTFGGPIHTYMGDITATLFAPNGSSHVIFGRTLATTAAGAGDGTDLAGPYVFADSGVVPPNGGWWQTASLLTAAVPMTAGDYRTTNAGGAGAANPQPPTNINPSFASVGNANGTWILRVVDGCANDTGAVSAAAIAIATTGFVRSRADFDGDGRTDLSVFRPSEGNWYLNRSTDGLSVQNFGMSGDIPAPGDFDGDGRADMALFRPSTGVWWILRSSGGVNSIAFGLSGDIPVVGDYNGDGTSDIAVFRQSNSTWYIQHTGGSSATLAFGALGDLPVRGDYSGDGSTDIAVYRPSNGQWWIRSTAGGITTFTFGNSTDKPVPADYDGDNEDDLAIYRPSNGQWWIRSSFNGALSSIAFGISTDVPVPGDYNGDGADDRAIYRNGAWWVNYSSGGILTHSFGLSTDIPIPSKYVP